MDILHIIKSEDIGGAERMLIDLIDASQKQYKTGVIVVGNGPVEGILEKIQCPVYRLRAFNGTNDLSFEYSLLRAIRKFKPKIIQSHIEYMNLYAGIGGKLLGIPVVATFHSYNKIESYREKLLMKIVNLCCNRIVLVDAGQKEHFKRFFNDSKTIVIKNGMRINKTIYDFHRRNDIRNNLRLDVSDNAIISVGNIRPVKGQRHLCEAISKISTNAHIRLLIAGGGEISDTINYCEMLGILDIVIMLGFRDDICDLLTAADIYVCPSLSEATSLALMEAMAAALPIVATRVGGNKELIKDGECGILVEPGKGDEIANAIQFMLKNKEKAKEMGMNAKRRLETYYSHEKMSECYFRLYDNIIT
jgi:L-malate glycosyltransferase